MKIKIHKTNRDECCVLREKNFRTARHASLVTRHAAFTLTELMLVVAIIGILAALVIPKISGNTLRAQVTAVQADIKGGLKTAIGNYEVDNGMFPHSLDDLVKQPANAKNWHGPYLDSAPVDPWKNTYIYYFPGKHNSSDYDLSSAGPDGKEGTDDDIGNW